MKIKALFILFILICVIFSSTLVVASDNITNGVDSENTLNQQELIIEEDNNDSLFEENAFSQSQEENLLYDTSIEIYVGENKTIDGGNGSYDNPYATLDLACKNVKGEEKATINIFNGTYYLGSLLKFNTSNLFINGINGDVIIRNEKDTTWDQQAFSLQSPLANFTMKNIIFNSSVTAVGGQFTPFIGTANYGTYINCTFKGTLYTLLYGSKEFNSKFINCIITDFDYCLFRYELEGSKFVYFENCIFLNPKMLYLTQTISYGKNISINGVWFGQNKIADYVRNIQSFKDGSYVLVDIPIIRYAIFSVSENYLGDNQYEIVGKLNWNGTNSSEGMEIFPPMTVTLTSTTGEIQSTVNLINGSFKVNYTSNSLDNKILAKLDSEQINLTFESKLKDYTFNISEITDVKVGDTKEITITLPNDASGKIVISIGDNNFNGTVDGNTTKVNVTGFVLGENIINITYSGNERYESRTKNITVYAVKKTTTITAQNVSANYNVAKDLVITLTDVDGEFLANKTINVVVGNINVNLTTNASGQASINVATLAPSTYPADITFAGDEAYAKSNATAKVVINKIASSITATKVTATYNVAKNLVITLTANGKALNGQKVTVKVGTISKTLTTDANGQVSVDVSKLTPKTYTATFTYAGDSINAGSTNTAKVVVNKAAPKLTAKKATFKAKKKTKKYSIVLKDNKGKAIKKAKVTLKVKGKTYKATTNNKGKATFKITKLTKKGKNTATIKFGGNNYFKSISKKVKIVVKK